MRRRLMALPRALIAAGIVVLGAAGIGHASSIGVGQGSLAAGSVPIGRCTSAALGVVANPSGSSIVSVTVSGIPATCASATLLVTVNDGSVQGSGTSTVPPAGGSVTVILGSATAVTMSVETDLVLLGP
jgi:hypothetical protein